MDNSAAVGAKKSIPSCVKCGSPSDTSSELCAKCIAADSLNTATSGSGLSTGQTGTEPKKRWLHKLKTHEKSIKHWSHTCSNTAQVIALLLVGAWTIKTFSHSEAPSLEPHLRADMQIEWENMGKTDICEARLTVKIENTSKQIINVTAMHIDGWISSLPKGPLPHFSPDEELKKGDHFFNQDFPSNYMLGQLMPGAVVYDSFPFEFKKSPAERVMWEAKFKTDPQLGYDPQASEWDLLCNPKPYVYVLKGTPPPIPGN